ncbi:MAG: hypothetical protein JWR18_781 [Segetibacter sp.]|jgi:hypothetical protein|nr:hypothetical protein [Segetibacter sp.]
MTPALSITQDPDEEILQLFARRMGGDNAEII